MNIENLLPRLPRGPYLLPELRFLAQLTVLVKDLEGDYLEVGSLAGRSSVIIGTAAKESGVRLSCVDVWDSGKWDAIAEELGTRAKRYPKRPQKISEIFRTNMERLGLSETITPIMDKSENVLAGWSKPLKFIHIDGCHEYEFVKRDIEWRNHLVKDGIICFHDYQKKWPGVIKAIDEAFNHDENFSRVLKPVRSVVAFRRDK